MARKTVTETNTSSSSQTQSQQHSQSQSQSQSQSTTKNVLDQELLSTILSGLQGMMTDEEITNFAEALLRPQLNANLEAAQHSYETTKLQKEQEIENLATSLQKGIAEQNRAYRRSVANVETAALSRGMGRSSYKTFRTRATRWPAPCSSSRMKTGGRPRRFSSRSRRRRSKTPIRRAG